MRFPSVSSLRLLVVACCAALGAATAPAATIPTYFLGNSLTDTIQYGGFQALAQARGHAVPLGRHMIPGASLKWIWDNPAQGFSEAPFGFYPNALPNHTWSALSLQPFTLSLADDLDYATRFTNLALPASPDLTLFIFARWPGTGDAFDVRWARLPHETRGYEGRVHQEQLTLNVRNAYPGRNVFMVPVGHVMFELNQRMKAGQVPGLTNIHQFYYDGIHLDNRGQYLMALTYFTTFFREDPRGLPVPTQYGTIDPGLVAIMQDAVLDVVAAHPLSGVVLDLPFEVGTSVLRPAIQNTPYSANLDANFGASPFSWSLVGGALPSGIALAANGTLSGTPSVLGNYTITVRVTDGSTPAQLAQATLSLSVEEDTVPAITTASPLPPARLGSPYFLQFPGFAAIAGNGALGWSLASGSLPPGLTLGASGSMIGAPQATGSYTFTVRVTDSDATPDSATKPFTLTVAAAHADTLTARKLAADLRVDGLLDESFWNLSREITTAAGASAGEAGRNQGARYDLVWDHAFLYLAVRVTDSALNPGSDSFLGDAVHLFLDGLHDREAVFNADDRHYAVCPFGRGAERNGRGDGIIRAARRTAAGYDIEIAVPWSNLGLVAVDNLSLGFDLIVADDDAGTGADAVLRLGTTELAGPSPSGFRSLLLTPTSTGGARAGLLAQDGLDYPAGALNTRNGGEGWGGGWVVQNNNTTQPGYQSASAFPLAAPAGLHASPGYATGGTAFLASGRPISTAVNGPFGPLLDGGLIGAPNTTLWVSWLVRRDTGGRSEVALHPSTISTATGGPRVAVFAQNERWQLLAGGSTIDSGAAATANETFFLVMRLDFGASTDTATLYVNPAPGIAPGAHQARIQNIADARFRSLHWFPGNSSGNGSLDEIRIGTTYAAVAPTIETAPVLVAAPTALAVRSGANLAYGANLAGSNLAVNWTRGGAPLPDSGPVLSRRPFLREHGGAYQFTARNRLGSAASAGFAINAVGRTLAEWRAEWFGGAPSGAPDAVSGPDALPNLLKFVLGWTPGVAPTAPPEARRVSEGGDVFLALRFTLDTGANDVALVVEGSTDLAEWTALATYQAPDLHVAGAGVQVARAAAAGRPGVDEITVRAPVAAPPRYFMRLRAIAGAEVP